MFGPNKKRGFLIPVMFAAALLWGCSGSDGSAGPAGPTGPAGPAGPPAPVPDPVTAAIDSAQIESCSTCHNGVGEEHQAIYDKYVDPSTLALTFNSLTSAPNGGNFTVTLTYTITKNGVPYIDTAKLDSMDQVRFEAISYDSATGMYLTECRLNENYVALGGGQYTVQDTNCPYAPNQQTAGTQGAHVYGYVAQGALFTHEGASSELPEGSHVHLYDDVASASLAYGTANAANGASYVSAANVQGCEKCHGTPYLKHGYRDPVVANLPNFASCKSCHYDDRTGGHPDWQYMVDEPLDWANKVPLLPGEYDYTANIMNDVHMSHAMEFPYPQSMSNCATCHGPVNDQNGVLIPGSDKLTQVLDNGNFEAETCLSCHPLTGTDAWPEALAGQLTTYNQPHRAPPLEYLWEERGVTAVHDIAADCQSCHGNPAVPNAPPFNELHTGYDIRISDAGGQKYGDLYTVSIDQVTLNGDLLTVNFTSNDPAITPEVLVSLYGWDSKHFIIPSHSADGTQLCLDRRGNPAGCSMEYVPESSGGGANPLFAEDAASIPGDWMVTLDLAAYVPTVTDTIPNLIASGDIRMAEITVTPELVVGGEDVVLNAVGASFDLGGSMVVDDYFKGDNATVDTAKCDVCHDSLASSFHDGSGRGGGGIQVCKNCHVTTSPGSHLEMASRSIDSYVHAIHSFQPFDLDDVDAANDPVIDARTDQHKLHTFPNFTIRNCEACHIDGTFNVPDQSKSMPGVLSKSWAIADRNIGAVPEYVTGPASRACGGCHRADLINADLAGDLAAFNAHTKAFGTLVENDDDDAVLYGIIDKIMGLFE